MTDDLIKGGPIVTAVDDYTADILIRDGRIEAIARDIPATDIETHHSNVDYSLLEGRSVTGKVEQVFLRGKQIVDGDRWLGQPGSGQFQRRSASGRI
jgi:dihydroorotase-like cyclic amidohydrolase